MDPYEKLSYRELQDLCRHNRKDISECKLSSSREELIEFLQYKNLCKVPSVKQLLRIITNAIKTRNNYITISSSNIECLLRVSSSNRRSSGYDWETDTILGAKEKDIDIAQITVKSTHKSGCATLFILRLIKAASLLAIPRGVYLEQTITPASKALAKSLIRKGIMFPDPNLPSFFSYFPPVFDIDDGVDDDSLL
jgi:hypothetical protein